MYFDASRQTAQCGCVIQIETELDWPSCRCSGNDCYRDEYEFTYEIEIVESCPSHDAAGATMALEE